MRISTIKTKRLEKKMATTTDKTHPSELVRNELGLTDSNEVEISTEDTVSFVGQVPELRGTVVAGCLLAGPGVDYCVAVQLTGIHTIAHQGLSQSDSAYRPDQISFCSDLKRRNNLVFIDPEKVTIVER
jgi:hypothetical protein